MKKIKQIYFNDFGTSFYWRKEDFIVLDKVQIIFRETGFYFTKEELYLFKSYIDESFSLNTSCADCSLKNKCQRFLLRTPCLQIDLAVTMQELKQVNDLIEGTLFKIALDDYLHGAGMN